LHSIEPLTVLFVTWNIRSSGVAMKDDAARFMLALASRTFDLGPVADQPQKPKIGVRFNIEFEGEVKPSDFTERISVKRTIRDTRFWKAPSQQRLGEAKLVDHFSSAEDSSSHSSVDEDPQSDAPPKGKIYDVDSPGFEPVSLAGDPIGTVVAMRQRFETQAFFNGMPCSDPYKTFVNRAAVRVQNGWDSIALIKKPDGSSGDNLAGEGDGPGGGGTGIDGGVPNFQAKLEITQKFDDFNYQIKTSIVGGNPPFLLQFNLSDTDGKKSRSPFGSGIIEIVDREDVRLLTLDSIADVAISRPNGRLALIVGVREKNAPKQNDRGCPFHS